MWDVLFPARTYGDTPTLTSSAENEEDLVCEKINALDWLEPGDVDGETLCVCET